MFAENWGGSYVICFQGVYEDQLDTPILCSEFMLSDMLAWDPGCLSDVLPSPVWKVTAKLDVLPKQLQSVWAIVATASLLQDDYLSVSCSIGRSTMTSTLGLVAWSTPSLSTVARNTDDSFDVDSGIGIGVVARDSLGWVLCGLAQHLARLTEAVFAEQAALLAGLHLSLDHGWPSVLLETVSVQTVNRLGRSPSSDLSIYGPSLEPIRALLTGETSCYCKLRETTFCGKSRETSCCGIDIIRHSRKVMTCSKREYVRNILNMVRDIDLVSATLGIYKQTAS
ncbi:hypothetical protein V6N11_017694 [Hibiscus sabdariffa]|uniref:RNase H type-1 domain-containing protein n=1 Tax=Hibiscus sabdariffa TaxID=183260 RepID=A0ABR2TYT9_9ROSI